MKNTLETTAPYFRWWATPHLVMDGVITDLENTALFDNSGEFLEWGQSYYNEEETYRPEAFGPCVASYLTSVGNNSGFDDSQFSYFLEEVYHSYKTLIFDAVSDFTDVYESEEEYVEDYDEETLALVKSLVGKETSEFGLHWAHEVKNSQLFIRILIGDGTADWGSNDTQEELAPFDVDGLDWDDCEKLDSGDVTYLDSFEETDNLTEEVLTYSLARYLWKTFNKEDALEEFLYTETPSLNKTEGLVKFLSTLTTEDKEELEFFELEGEEVTTKWLELVDA